MDGTLHPRRPSQRQRQGHRNPDLQSSTPKALEQPMSATPMNKEDRLAIQGIIGVMLVFLGVPTAVFGFGWVGVVMTIVGLLCAVGSLSR
jgi:hypothetical protein